MLVTVGGREYEIGGIPYGQLPVWKLIKQGGQPMTHQMFEQLPEADKRALFDYVQQHIASLSAR